jgi:hypothetical protein
MDPRGIRPAVQIHPLTLDPDVGLAIWPAIPNTARAIIFIDYSQRSVEGRSQRISATGAEKVRTQSPVETRFCISAMALVMGCGERVRRSNGRSKMKTRATSNVTTKP